MLKFHLSRSRSAVLAALSFSIAMLCAGQNTPAVYSNPRASADDPRIGLKGGLHDAAEAASGLEKVASLPKPAGFNRSDHHAGAPC